MIPFRPATAQTVNINVSASSQNVQVTATTGMQQIRVANLGSQPCWIAHGTSNAITANTTANYPVPAGCVEIISCQGPVWMAAIAAGSTGSVYFTPGEGI